MKLLKLNSLHIIQFKNYENSKVNFSPRFNFITGLNGMGKTNLLDAIYYLGMTKSFFHNRDVLNVMHGKDFFRLEASLQNGLEVSHLVVKVQPGHIKVFDKNGREYDQLIEHVGVIPMLISAPADSALIMDSSQVRRRFFDGLIAQLDRQYLQHLMSYKKLLRQRNAGLKKKPVDFALMEIYTEKMQHSANYIFHKRVEVIDQIQPIYRDYYHKFGGVQEQSSIAYQSQLHELDFLKASHQALQKDSMTGRTSVGIHRDDFQLRLNDLPAKQFASQGQMKSILFALHLSKYEILKMTSGQKPIMLLDDIFDKLDDRRVRFLIKILQGDSFGQIFVTDTSEPRLRKVVEDLGIEEFQFFEIQEGNVLNKE
jgi:DNA replication and repair protein RecF